MHFPTWVDLKGQDSVPETVHHVVCYIDPIKDTSWHKLSRKIQVSTIVYKHNFTVCKDLPYSKSRKFNNPFLIFLQVPYGLNF